MPLGGGGAGGSGDKYLALTREVTVDTKSSYIQNV